ncbi:MAG: diacylglycerol/lipid kinase family protein [Lacrimispora saccharolytica]
MYHVIFNPGSRSGAGNRIWLKLRSRLLAENVNFREYRTCYRGHARKITSSITAPGVWKEEDVLIVIGGDGTVNEVVSGIRQLSKVTAGLHSRRFRQSILPEGFRFRRCGKWKSAGIGARSIDVGRVNVGGKVRRFVISSGIGFDASICHEALSSRIKNVLNRMHLGKLTYMVIALRQLFFFRDFRMEFVTEDRRKVTCDKVLFAAAMNMKCEGGGVKFCPGADCTDGVMDWIVVEGLAKWKRLAVFPLAVLGKHTGFHEVHIRKVKTATLKTDRKLPVHLDGESGGMQDYLTVTVEPEKLRVLTGTHI